jgi:antitoxin HicB
MSDRKVKEYLALPYHIEAIYDASGKAPGWFARVVELPGCMTQAESRDEVLAMIQDAMRDWIEVGIEEGQPIPGPLTHETYSGKFVVRVPRSLHRQLAEAAESDGVSLIRFRQRGPGAGRRAAAVN